ncbi:MAG: glycosyltransferase family 2 protein [Candidatus Poribacteria bacterium]
MKLSIVVPVYKEEGNIQAFINATIPVLSSITPDFEILFILDPSPDATEELIRKANQHDQRIKLILLSRRFGQPMATLAGLHYSTGDAIIVIDVDLQDPPELIAEMVKKWEAGYDVVYAQRKNRSGETIIKKTVAHLGYKLINKITDVNIPPNTGDFRLMSRRVVNQVISLKESHGFLRGMVAFVGFKQTSVLFDRPARFSGSGNYNRFLGSIRIGVNGLVCYSSRLLALSSMFGFMIAGLSFISGIIYFIMKLLGAPFPIGNPTVVILVLFLGGVQLISIGLVGEYIGRIYDEVKGRPRFIIDSELGFEQREQKVITIKYK